MAQVVVLIPDLLLGSNVVGTLQAAGHETRLVSTAADVDFANSDVVIVDFGNEAVDSGDVITRAHAGENPTKTIAIYSHVDVAAKKAADALGFDLVVPRSRMAREGAGLVARLLA